MSAEMGKRFFDRNIRAGLSENRSPNRAIRQSLADIVLKQKERPDVFVFNHNGVTLAAERLELVDGKARITEPRP